MDVPLTQSAVPQMDLDGLSRAQLVQCANRFYGVWVDAKRECEGLRRQNETIAAKLRTQTDAAAERVRILEQKNATVAAEAHAAGGRARREGREKVRLQRAVAEAPQAAQAALLLDDLCEAEARCAELERAMRRQTPPEMAAMQCELEVLRRQRAADVDKLVRLECMLHEANGTIATQERLLWSGGSAAARPRQGTSSSPPPTVTAPPVPAPAHTPIPPRVVVSTSSQTWPQRQTSPTSGDNGDAGPRIQQLERSLRAALETAARKDAIIAELQGLLATPPVALSDAPTDAQATIQRLRRRLSDADAAAAEREGRLADLDRKRAAASAEAAELRNTLHETRASRAALQMELNELRRVPLEKVKALLQAEAQQRRFEADRVAIEAKAAERDDLVLERSRLLADCALWQRRITECQADTDDAHEQIAALQSALEASEAHAADLATRVAIDENLVQRPCASVALQADLGDRVLGERLVAAALRGIDAVYLEHEARLRDEFAAALEVGILRPQHRQILDLRSQLFTLLLRQQNRAQGANQPSTPSTE